MSESQTGCKLKTIRSDNGKEYINHEFQKFLSDHGINRQTTVSYTPQQNGVAERANRTLIEIQDLCWRRVKHNHIYGQKP